jgi:hypothetical protein
VKNTLMAAGLRGAVAALALTAALGVTAGLAVTGGLSNQPPSGTTSHSVLATADWNSTGEPPVCLS